MTDWLYGCKRQQALPLTMQSADALSFEALEAQAQKDINVHYIYFASMQDLRGSRRVNKQKGIEKNNDIFSTQWDLMIVDEAHEGVYSRLGQEVIAAFLQNRSLHTLYLSGTPYNIQRMFDTREVFHWDYTMEQQAKQQWTSLHPNTTNPYEGLAQMNILTYDISDKMRSLTKADGLKVAVRLNESEMAVTKAENGLALAKMLLCQMCGMPLDSNITLADENSDDITATGRQEELGNETTDHLPDDRTAIEGRAETRLLSGTVDLARAATKMARAANLPQAMVTGGYIVTNPNLYDSFHRSFAGMWNIGLMVRVPVWNWMEGAYRIRAAKAATTMAEYELTDAKEKMELQINQQRFKVKEANRKLAMAEKNIKSAEENLRCANIGFKEGVISSTDVLGAQTAWYEAQSQKIDAEVEARMSHLGLRKALGVIGK